MSTATACLAGLPSELLSAFLPRLLDRARPAARLATSCRRLRAALADEDGRLCVGSLVTCRLGSLVDGLARASLPCLEVLRVDLSAESRERLCGREIEQAVKQLSESLASAVELRTLAVRLASFDVSMGRLRLSHEAWEALILGLGSLAKHHQLRSLELSSIAIKSSQATRTVGGPAEGCRQLRRAASAPSSPSPSTSSGSGAAASSVGSAVAADSSLTFLEALRQLKELEELVLTYDEIFGNTAQLLPSVFCALEQLKRVDLARNHISKEEMQAVRQATPKEIELCGEDQQTFFFY